MAKTNTLEQKEALYWSRRVSALWIAVRALENLNSHFNRAILRVRRERVSKTSEYRKAVGRLHGAIATFESDKVRFDQDYRFMRDILDEMGVNWQDRKALEKLLAGVR